MGHIRKLAKRLVENETSIISAWARESLFLRQLRKDSKLTFKVADRLGIKKLTSTRFFFPNENSETIFILAGGATVNRLSADQFRQIDSATSIGINFWPIHDFVPTALSTETDNRTGGPTQSNQFLSEKINKYENSPNDGPIILVLRPPWPPNPRRLYSLTGASNQLTYMYGRANVITRNPNNLDGDLERIVRRVARKSLPPSVLPDNGSSVVRLTFLALMQGFKHIVWVGVDQSSGPYFWTEDPIPEKYRDAAAMFPRESGRPHSTSSAENRPFSNDVYLRSLARAVSLATESQIYVAHSDSELSDVVQLYPWTDRQRASRRRRGETVGKS